MEKKNRRALIALGTIGSFVAFVSFIIYLAASRLVTLEMAKLMFAGLLGMYVGFGFLFLVYVLIKKME